MRQMRWAGVAPATLGYILNLCLTQNLRLKNKQIKQLIEYQYFTTALHLKIYSQKSEEVKNKKVYFSNHKGLAIMPHLLCWQGFGICQYACTLAAAHLRHTCQSQNLGLKFFFPSSSAAPRLRGEISSPLHQWFLLQPWRSWHPCVRFFLSFFVSFCGD